MPKRATTFRYAGEPVPDRSLTNDRSWIKVLWRPQHLAEPKPLAATDLPEHSELSPLLASPLHPPKARRAVLHVLKDRIAHGEQPRILSECCQRLLRWAALAFGVGVVFGRRPLQQTEDLVLSQLVGSWPVELIVRHRLILPLGRSHGQVFS